eukprot:s3399_g17.t1
MGAASSSSMAAVCLKPSEYHGDQNTAVVGRIVILKHQEIPQKKSVAAAAVPVGGRKGKVAAAAVPVGGRKGKGGKAGKKSAEPQTLRKLEAHLAATEALSEVLFVEAWGEVADQLAQKCKIGDLVAIQGGEVAAGEWSVLWQVPVEETRVAEVKAFLLQLYRSEVSSPQTITYDQTWTPCKRLASVLEQAPEETAGPADGA